MADRIKVYEETGKKGIPVWAWLLPLVLILALLGLYLSRHRTPTSPQSAVAGPAPATVAEPLPMAGAASTNTSQPAMPHLAMVHFATDQATLTPEATRTLDQAVAAMKANPAIHLRLEGFTDSTGTVPHNDTLSDRRTAAVADYLKSQGIPADRLTGSGFGPAEPVAPNSTPEGKADNRRVELFTR